MHIRRRRAGKCLARPWPLCLGVCKTAVLGARVWREGVFFGCGAGWECSGGEGGDRVGAGFVLLVVNWVREGKVSYLPWDRRESWMGGCANGIRLGWRGS